MMAGDQPLLAVPFIGKAVARMHDLAGGAEGEAVEAGVDGRVAAYPEPALVDLADGLVVEEVLEIIDALFVGEPRLVGNGGQEQGARCVVVGDGFGIERLQ